MAAVAKTVVITGASAGVGRATALEFATHGYDVALLARNATRLEAAATECRAEGVRALPIPADVADANAMRQAAAQVEATLGPIDVWVNVAMATIFAPFHLVTPDEFKRATEVTYLGQVYGTMAALRHMRARNRGVIVNVGSALAYRAIPLQSVYCGAKFALRGFTDSLRCELLHDRLNIHISVVDLPAVNTPQFDWALNKTGRRSQPVPPIYEPEVAARAIYFAAHHPRREFWVGWSTVKAIVANRVAPRLLDRYLARTGYSAQLAEETQPHDAPANLFQTVEGPYGVRGRFSARSRKVNWEALASRHWLSLCIAGGLAVLAGHHLWTRVAPKRR